MAVPEVAITSCLGDEVVRAYMWDVQTGTTLMTYRGDCAVTPAGLSLLSSEYLVASLQDKPFLRVWPVNSQQPLSNLRLICPGRVTHAQVSPDSCYVAVTVAEKLHIYQLASGRLVGTGARHFRPVTVVRWAKDSNLVVCGGEDGLVTIWPIAALVTSQSNPEPRHVLSDHALPVTDLVVTAGSRPRVLSVSSDRTCKIYSLHQGTLLLSLVFDKVLTAVTTSALETDVFVGTQGGAILQFSVLSPPRNIEYHLTTAESAPVFIGHSKTVRCLSASINGELLMSGSADGSVKIWHIVSRVCLQTFTHKGSIMNAFFIPKPKQLFENELKPSVTINSFKTANSEEASFVEVITRQSLSLSEIKEQTLLPEPASDSSDDRLKLLQKEIDLLRSINTNLYKFSIDKILAGNSVVPRPSITVGELIKKGNKKKKGLHKNKVLKTKTVASTINPSVNGILKKKKRRKRNKPKKNIGMSKAM